MMRGKRGKLAAISTEVALSLVLAVAVLFVILGLFGDNVKNMIADSNFKNIFSNNALKTGFNSFSKDYTNSQINVQIMGEQGLEMLRRKANNMALELMQNPTDENKTAVLYLAMAIQGIVGSPDLCVFMTEDSDKLCPLTEPGGYAYKVDLSGSSPKIAKASTSGVSSGSSVGLTMKADGTTNSAATGAYTTSRYMSATTGQTNSSSGTTTGADAKYQYLQALTANFKGQISDGVSLVKFVETFASKNESKIDVDGLKKDLKQVLGNIQETAINSHEDCDSGLNTGKLLDKKCNSGKKFIGKNELKGVEAWVASSTDSLDKLSSKSSRNEVNTTIKNIVDGITSNDTTIWKNVPLVERSETILDILQDDHKENPKACDVYNGYTDNSKKVYHNGIQDIINKYLTNNKITVSKCSPH